MSRREIIENYQLYIILQKLQVFSTTTEEFISQKGLNFELLFEQVPQIYNLGREKAEIFYDLLTKLPNNNLSWF